MNASSPNDPGPNDPFSVGGDTNDTDVLARFRQDVPAMSAQARFQGRQRLEAAMSGQGGRPLRRPRTRRVLASAGVALALAGGVIGYQIAGPAGADTSAQAAEVLNDAAVTAAATAHTVVGLKPRPDQYIYLDVLHTTSGMNDRTQSWTSADGTRQGLVRTSGFMGDHSSPIDPYKSGDSLRDAPYLVLAKLPTDPDALLRILYADPAVLGDQQHNGTKADVALWGLLRDLVENVPAAQEAALFKVAAKVPHISYSDNATDAAGRPGVAVGLPDPRLGTIQFVFDRSSHAFLGERILSPGSTTQVEFNDTVQRTAVVDKPGQLPNP
ncbi:CU044_5270 family protein [Kitasatospora kazusensis]|uniref:CU044_5270 family protein n=1 Tax=Kitasatospora kazusensis TaxID=407974 RepID=A0ABN2ZJ14_9ACTN